MKRAIISVSDKTGVASFAKQLIELGFEIISTGGTKKALQDAGIDVIGISNVTDFPEILEGRVKTLHPAIHGGLLAKQSDQNHMKALEEQGISPIHLVVVNLYPFKETIKKNGTTFEDAIENIDIGGPAMLRASAKNHESVTVVTDPTDYDVVLEELSKGEVSGTTRRRLAAKVFRHTASYDALIAEYLTKESNEKYPESLTLTYERKQTLRYGENPHQEAAFYETALPASPSLANAEQLHGKELSYNNINDADAALALVSEFKDTVAAVAVKHTNPCGVGIADTLEGAFNEAYEADPVSIFGGIVAVNETIDKATATKLADIFLEVIIAPDYSEDALAILKKKKNIRLLKVNNTTKKNDVQTITSVQGGLLVQDEDRSGLNEATVEVVTERKPTEDEWKSLKLSWSVVKHVKSNAIVLVNGNRTVGVGAGQMNRVGACDIAVKQAGELAKGSALASDAFFPMKDTVEKAAEAGIKVIIQPGGSIRDEESIQAANEAGIAMVFTGMRHFRHARRNDDERFSCR
ncbi:bifunctional phosphoribosylaminoimidazolecarboxamide formyltransferase/IMP cyclohydrolase [Geomicrobium sp. JCM 19038]|uniref:bifunctional phosphoribosylaminoimidazolecarboxamide formyltransferase/IMP cyclohydrolase n=1 Tax=Geomicrobium sp. JCM 19038 TaxID=1460635 RepID=UPI00045F1D86|nr:bifunctional phosphoribosylaminoimidazolecarboxamide formyltransferase/IMP cyclohydrolase [Geomicrobium sp. JCM 19038]GAK08881.1 IMP cyclohydrolase [Geomicrobium sp. JCM 19038]